MSIGLEPRNTQTRVKHEILSKYLDTWGGIIVNGLAKSAKKQKWRFIYVDCFSYIGMYSGEAEEVLQGRVSKPVYGSPIIGIQALEKLSNHARKRGITIRTNTVLIEKQASEYQELLQTLDKAGLSSRVKDGYKFSELSDGNIAVVNEDARNLLVDLINFTSGDDTWAFYLLDPWGPSGIPYEFVREIVSRDHHDVMLNFIYEDLLRKTGLALKDKLSPQHRELVENWSRAFGSDNWITIARDTLIETMDHRYWRDDVLQGIPLDDMKGSDLLSDEELSRLKENRFVNAYKDVLQQMDPSLAIKLVDLRFPDRDRTMFYLFLTTHDATGALSINEILHKAKLLEYELRYRLQIAKKTAPPPGQPTLFNLDPSIPNKPPTPRPTAAQIAEVIINKFGGMIMDRRNIYRGLLDETYFRSEVDAALLYLRKEHKAKFDGQLMHDTRIKFLKPLEH
jgi:three-Cys-motif partner protein